LIDARVFQWWSIIPIVFEGIAREFARSPDFIYVGIDADLGLSVVEYGDAAVGDRCGAEGCGRAG
jgi:hypothetical protein